MCVCESVGGTDGPSEPCKSNNRSGVLRREKLRHGVRGTSTQQGVNVSVRTQHQTVSTVKQRVCETVREGKCYRVIKRAV